MDGWSQAERGSQGREHIKGMADKANSDAQRTERDYFIVHDDDDADEYDDDTETMTMMTTTSTPTRTSTPLVPLLVPLLVVQVQVLVLLMVVVVRLPPPSRLGRMRVAAPRPSVSHLFRSFPLAARHGNTRAATRARRRTVDTERVGSRDEWWEGEEATPRGHVRVDGWYWYW